MEFQFLDKGIQGLEIQNTQRTMLLHFVYEFSYTLRTNA